MCMNQINNNTGMLNRPDLSVTYLIIIIYIDHLLEDHLYTCIVLFAVFFGYWLFIVKLCTFLITYDYRMMDRYSSQMSNFIFRPIN